MNKISVIVPVYNVERYVERCVRSICSQTYDNLEIILIDDGSTDQSGKICDNLAKEDQRIQVVHQSNGGVSSARNLGLEIATGDWVAFVDSDDYIDKEMMKILLMNAINTESDISLCDFRTTCKDDEKSDYSKNVYEMDARTALGHLYVDKDIAFVIMSAKIYRQELFKDIVFPKLTKSEDNYVQYQVIERAKKLVYTPSRLYMYYQRENSAVHTFDRSCGNDFEMFDIQMQHWKRKKEMQLMRMCFERNYKRLLMTLDCVKAGKPSDDFYDIVKKQYEKAVLANIKDVKIGFVEKKCYLLVSYDGSQNMAMKYIRMKIAIRNYNFRRKYDLKF